MGNDWLYTFLGWLGGIPSGLIANWLFHKWHRRKKVTGEYFTTTWTKDYMDFEGRVRTRVEMKDIVDRVLGTGETDA